MTDPLLWLIGYLFRYQTRVT